jgi:subtilisin family serine protease
LLLPRLVGQFRAWLYMISGQLGSFHCCSIALLSAAVLLFEGLPLCVDNVRRVKDHKAKNRIASAVLSMSLAGPWSASLNDAIDAASAAGITVVTAAGATQHKRN